MQHALFGDRLRGRLFVRHVSPRLEQDQHADLVQHLAQVGVEVSVRCAVGKHPIVRLGIGWRHHQVASHTPAVAVRPLAELFAGLAIHLPVRRHRIGRDDVGRDHAPAFLRCGLRRRRERARQRDEQGRPWLLVWLGHVADAELRIDAVLDCDVPEFALEVVRRILRPDPLDHVDRFGHHTIARIVVRVFEQLEIGHQSARTDAHQKAAFAHVIELRALGRDDRRMMVRNVDDGGAEPDVLRAVQEVGEEHHRRRERLGGGGEMFAEPQLVVAELLGQQRLPGVLLDGAPHRPVRRMNRHHEHPKPHSGPLASPIMVGGQASTGDGNHTMAGAPRGRLRRRRHRRKPSGEITR